VRSNVSALGILALAALGVTLAQCSGSGGTASTVQAPATSTPTPSPTPSPGPIVFTGSSITNNVMALPCNTNETFTVSQSGYSGTFQLVPSSTQFTLSPTSGNSSVTFTVLSLAGSSQVFHVTASNSAEQSGTLTINFTTGGQCG
jgi:hypothetical protein